MDNKRNKKEAVNHPEHYSNGKIECIDAMISAFGINATINFCHLNAFKYIWRAGKKDDAVQDIEKAKWYLDEMKELLNRL